MSSQLDTAPASPRHITPTEFHIRPAVPDDLHVLLEMARAFFIEAGHEKRGLKFDAASFTATVNILAPHGLLLVAERDGETIGMAAVDVARAYWKSQRTARLRDFLLSEASSPQWLRPPPVARP